MDQKLDTPILASDVTGNVVALTLQEEAEQRQQHKRKMDEAKKVADAEEELRKQKKEKTKKQKKKEAGMEKKIDTPILASDLQGILDLKFQEEEELREEKKRKRKEDKKKAEKKDKNLPTKKYTSKSKKSKDTDSYVSEKEEVVGTQPEQQKKKQKSRPAAKKKIIDSKMEEQQTMLQIVKVDSPPPTPPPARKVNSPPSASPAAKKSYKKKPTESALLRTSPKGIWSLMISLNDDQKASIRQIGFGGLLQLSTQGNNPELITYLINRFNCSRCSFKFDFDEMMVDDDDVEAIFDLPRGNKSILEALSEKENDDFWNLLNNWRRRWGIIHAAPLTAEITSNMVNREDSGDNFVRDFIVLVVTTLFKSMQGRQANHKILKILYNIDGIKEYNWCSFMRECLLSTVQEFQVSTAKNKYFAGPGLLMMLLYVDRVEFCGRKDKLHSFPVCSNWEMTEIDKRVKMEKKLGGLGQGKVVDRLRKPETVIMKDSEAAQGQKIPTAKLSGVLKKMTESVNEFREVMEDMGRGTAFTTELLSTPFELILRKDHSPKTPSIKSQSPEKKVTKTPSILDDDMFSDPKLADEIFKLWDSFSKPNKVTKVMNIDEGISGPSFSLGIEFEDDDCEKMVKEKGKLEEEVKKSKEEKEQKDVQEEEESETEEEKKEEEKRTPIADEDFDKIFEESEDEISDVVYRRNPFRTCKDLPLVLRSPFWTRNKIKLERMVTMKEKIISEYAFFKVGPEEEKKPLFNGFTMTLTRKDFCTLYHNEWVVSSIVDVWCQKLNADNKRRALTEPKRVFFSTFAHAQLVMCLNDPDNESKSTARFDNLIDEELHLMGNVNIEDAAIVFFPVLNNVHYWILCFNFLDRVIQIIDNRPLHREFTRAKNYGNEPTNMRAAFANYLRSKGFKMNVDVEKFQISLIKMPWRSSNNYNDCGIYCMRHMETYKGKLVDDG